MTYSNININTNNNTNVGVHMCACICFCVTSPQLPLKKEPSQAAARSARFTGIVSKYLSTLSRSAPTSWGASFAGLPHPPCFLLFFPKGGIHTGHLFIFRNCFALLSSFFPRPTCPSKPGLTVVHVTGTRKASGDPVRGSHHRPHVGHHVLRHRESLLQC